MSINQKENKILEEAENREETQGAEPEGTSQEEPVGFCSFEKLSEPLESPESEKLNQSETEGDTNSNESGESHDLSESQKPSAVKRMQLRNLFILVVATFGIIYFLYSMITGSSASKKPSPPKETSEKVEFVFSKASDQIDVKSFLMDRIQHKLEENVKANQGLSQQINDLNKFRQEFTDAEKKLQGDFQQLKDQVSSFTNPNKKADGGSSDILESPADNTGGRATQEGFPLASAPAQPEQQIRIDKLSFGGAAGQNSEVPSDAQKTAKNYVPAGTFVKAIMLGGADVAAGAMSQSDPMPMLFRILDNGTLPNYRQSSLKNCIVTAAVIGDISSETGKIRLERISCTRPNGKVIDLAVEGTVFGQSGKNGIRGTPVWREKDLLQRAFVAGTLSGISDGVSQKYTTTTLNPSGAMQTIDNNAIFKYGAAQGIGKAMDKLAEYNIHRAEQYHPVIQISAGALVDIVFLKGFFLGEQTEQNLNQNSDKDSANNFYQQPADDSKENNSNQAAEQTLRRMKSDA